MLEVMQEKRQVKKVEKVMLDKEQRELGSQLKSDLIISLFL